MGGAGGYEKCLEAVVKYKKALSWFRAALSCVEDFSNSGNVNDTCAGSTNDSSAEYNRNSSSQRQC